MNVTDAITQRHATRAFTDKSVSTDIIQSLLDIARHSPSGANTQPWHVAVVRGETKQQLQNALQQTFAAETTSNADYAYYPTSWKAPYSERRKACGLQLYQSLDISKQDKEKRLEQWAANYRAFDAPVLLLFFIDAIMETGSYLNYGMFLQSLMLAAQDRGLATCPQASLAEYPDIVRSTLHYSDDYHVVCGMALGYEDTTAAVNRYRTPREEVSTFTQFFD